MKTKNSSNLKKIKAQQIIHYEFVLKEYLIHQSLKRDHGCSSRIAQQDRSVISNNIVTRFQAM